MNLAWIDDFLHLAESGNYRSTANARFVSQSALSRRIKALEVWAGAPLFNRQTSPVTLTPAGVIFQKNAQDIVGASIRLRANIRELNQERDQEIHFATLITLANIMVPRWLRSLDPPLTNGFVIRTDFRGTGSYFEALESNVVDFFIGYEIGGRSNLREPPLFEKLVLETDQLVPVCIPNKKGGPAWDLSAIAPANIPCLQYPAEGILSAEVADQMNNLYCQHNFCIEFESPVISTLKSMAIEGYGVAWLPAGSVKDALASEQLIVAGSEAKHALLNVVIYYAVSCDRLHVQKFWHALNEVAPENRTVG